LFAEFITASRQLEACPLSLSVLSKGSAGCRR